MSRNKGQRVREEEWEEEMMEEGGTLTALAVSSDCSGGIPTSRSLSSCWMKKVMSRPAMGMCFIQLPIT